MLSPMEEGSRSGSDAILSIATFVCTFRQQHFRGQEVALRTEDDYNEHGSFQNDGDREPQHFSARQGESGLVQGAEPLTHGQCLMSHWGWGRYSFLHWHFCRGKKKSEAHLNDSWTESNQHILPGSCTSHSADKAAVLVTSKATTNACKEKHCPWANSVLTHADAKWHRKKCLPLLISSGVIFTFPCYP